MSWIRDSTFEKNNLCYVIEKIIKEGEIPKHIAIIMDGNRRFARKNSLSTIQEGHSMGFDTLANTLQWCADFGITTVTVYAFSIENYKRSTDEVEGLWNLVRNKMNKLFEEEEKLKERGVCVKFIGNLVLLPEDIRKLVEKAMDMTKNNNKATLNVCLSYTSRDEMCRAIKCCAKGVQDGILLPTDITESLLEKCLYMNDLPDLLIRTSGEVRLSDFLLWQSSFAVLSFVKVLWPEFTVWHFYAAILKYQQDCQKVRNLYDEHKRFVEKNDNIEIIRLIQTDSDSKIESYKKDRCKRIELFLNTIHSK